MTAYAWSSLKESDVEAWSRLFDDVAMHDDTDQRFAPDDLLDRLRAAGTDPAQDTWAVWARPGDAPARLAAFGQVDGARGLDHDGVATCRVSGTVHPAHRGRGLGTALFEGMEERARAVTTAQHPGAPGQVMVAAGVEGSAVQPLLEARGYRVARHFDQLRRDLTDLPVVGPMPAGVELRVVASDLDELSESVRTAHNDAFRDHWGSAPLSSQRWGEDMMSRAVRLNVSVVAVERSGRALSYVLAEQFVDRVLYLARVGTVRDARGGGLAAACLTETLRRAAATGEYDCVDLHVDSTSLTGATRLYERLGWRLCGRTAAYRLAL